MWNVASELARQGGGIERPHDGLRAWRARLNGREIGRALLILAAYGIAFTLLRSASARWATHRLFSVWFPAAGLRFAFLWLTGSRWTVPAALAELVVSVGFGTVELSHDLALSLLGVVAPCLVYGAVIRLVRLRSNGDVASEDIEPIAFAKAAVLGPVAACVAALPWALPLSLERGTISPMLLLSALAVFTMGDLLGILILAPPILWLASRVQRGRWSIKIHGRGAARFVELGALMVCAWALVWLFQRLGDGLVLAPVLLAACWCGLRAGRAIAWAAVVTTAIIVLPMTGIGASDPMRVQVHMQLACVAVGAYLAGSYADAQARAIAEIGRRDRLLLQAERLKTLRGMSLAVIHEVSQPLSTIAIEAHALVGEAEKTGPEAPQMREIASLIARKADDLAELIRRLRAFGSGGQELSNDQSLPQLVADVIALAAPEGRDARVAIEPSPGPEITARVHDVEIRQALLNLVRNAIAAAPKPGGKVVVGWEQTKSGVQLWVENQVGSRPSPRGMGVGLIIARTIVQAHGGQLTAEASAPGRFRSTLHIPSAEGADEC